MIDVLVTGAAGKMGSLSAATIAAQDDLRLVALVDPERRRRGGDGALLQGRRRGAGAHLAGGRARVQRAGRRVREHRGCCSTPACRPWSAPPASTTPRSTSSRARAAASGAGLRRSCPTSPSAPCCSCASPPRRRSYYEHAEIIEMHETGKIDAPSGTSLRTARLMAEAPGSALRGRRPATASPHAAWWPTAA